MEIEGNKKYQEAEPVFYLEFLFQEVMPVSLECHYQEACQ
jgi:hypothetical protein